MASDISYSSIAEIHSALTRKEYNPRDLFDYIQNNYSDWKKEETQDRILGSEIDYHNLSVEFSRQNCEPFAAAVATIGVEVYPMSTNLLADVIKYSQEIGDSDSCRAGIIKLKNISRKYWTWRTFAFVIDFLKDSLSSSASMEEFESNLEDAKKFIEEFKQCIPYEERAYVAEAELYENQNDYLGAINALQKGVEQVKVAPQCCMKLADMYLELGEYDKVEEFAKKGLLAAIQDQPSISVGYIYYLLAMAMDAKRIIQKQDGKSMEESEIQAIVTAYQTADKLFVNESRPSVAYRNTIKSKLIIIEMEEGISGETNLSSSESDKDKQQTGLSDLLALREMLGNSKDN